MKKLPIILLVVAMLFAFTACGDSNDSGDDSSDSVSVDEGILNVEITMPASYFEDETEADIIAEAEDEGIKSVVINSDGSVTYKMTKARRDEMLVEMKASMEEMVNSLVEGEDAVPAFEKIDYNDDLSEFDVYINTEYDDMISMYATGLYFAGAIYQTYDGVSEDSIDVSVNFIDNSTGDILNTTTYQDWAVENPGIFF